MNRKRLDKKIRRAEDDYEDAKERVNKWGFGMRPSELRAAKEHVDRCKEKLTKLLVKRKSDG